LLDRDVFRERLHAVLPYKNKILTRVFNADPLSEDEVYGEYCRYGEILASHICDTTTLLEKAVNDKKYILLEGAQGTLLDPDFGTYPYATSSSPLAGGGCLGTGIGPARIDEVLGVFKAYCTRVGGGPMPTELKDKTGDLIREQAHEYGTTTGRPRRCGWFDAVASRFSTRVNGYTQAVITRLDVLDILPTLKICTGYELDGKKIDYFPAGATALEKCQPVYEELPGWQTPISDIRDFEKLPPQAQRYLSRLEELVACPISIISVGMRREQTIFKMPIL